MSAYTTPEHVRAIMDETQLTDAQLTPYITSAHALMVSVFGTAQIGTDLLAEIERWLSAHLVAITRERIAKKEEAGGAKVEYAGMLGADLSATHYGQTAMIMDFTGRLRALSGKQMARIMAIPN